MPTQTQGSQEHDTQASQKRRCKEKEKEDAKKQRAEYFELEQKAKGDILSKLRTFQTHFHLKDSSIKIIH